MGIAHDEIGRSSQNDDQGNDLTASRLALEQGKERIDDEDDGHEIGHVEEHSNPTRC